MQNQGQMRPNVVMSAQTASKGPTPPKRTFISNKRFAYDEMVMATDGTRYYIKYLDENGSPQNSSSTQIGRTTIYRNIQAQQGTTTVTTAPRTAPPAPRMVVTQQQVPIQKTVQSATSIDYREPLRDDQGNFLCHICRKPFKHRHSIPFHIERFHKPGSDLRDCACPCGKKFLNKKYMRRHQKRRYEETGVTCGEEITPDDLELITDDGDLKGMRVVDTTRNPGPLRTASSAYSVAQLIQAIHAIQTGTAHSNLAARNFEVPRTTLSRYSKYELEPVHTQVLAEDEEAVVRDAIVAKLGSGEFFSTDFIITQTQQILNKTKVTEVNGKPRAALERPWLYYFITKYLHDFVAKIGPGVINKSREF